jgi:hypothetical protein
MMFLEPAKRAIAKMNTVPEKLTQGGHALTTFFSGMR